MGATLCVQAGIGQTKPCQRPPMEQVFADNLLNVLQLDEAVPDGLGVDHDDGTVLALIEAARLICPDREFQASFLQGVFERRFELFSALAAATRAGSALIPLVPTDKEVVLELWQWQWFPLGPNRCAAHTGF